MRPPAVSRVVPTAALSSPLPAVSPRVLTWVEALHTSSALSTALQGCRLIFLHRTENMHIDWNIPDNYEIISRIGGGKYSEVSVCSVFLKHFFD